MDSFSRMLRVACWRARATAHCAAASSSPSSMACASCSARSSAGREGEPCSRRHRTAQPHGQPQTAPGSRAAPYPGGTGEQRELRRGSSDARCSRGCPWAEPCGARPGKHGWEPHGEFLEPLDAQPPPRSKLHPTGFGLCTQKCRPRAGSGWAWRGALVSWHASGATKPRPSSTFPGELREQSFLRVPICRAAPGRRGQGRGLGGQQAAVGGWRKSRGHWHRCLKGGCSEGGLSVLPHPW